MTSSSLALNERLLDKQQYQQLKAAWVARQTSHTSAEMLIYNILRGFPADRGFTPLINPAKITSCGDDAWHGYNCAHSTARAKVVASTWVPSKYRNNPEATAAYLAGEQVTVQKYFKDVFGIELTPAIIEAINATVAK